jgi:hypothetical protein
MVVALQDERENLRIRVLEAINTSLTDFCERKRINKQDTIDGLLAWFLAQDGMLQSLILGQVDEQYRGQVAKLVLEQIAAEPPAPKTPVTFDAVAASIRSAPDASDARPRRRGGKRG